MFFLNILSNKHLEKHIGLLAAGALGCYSLMNIMQPLFFEKQKYEIKAVKIVLEQLAKHV